MKWILSVGFFLFSAVLFAQGQEFNWLIGTWQEGQKKSFEVWKFNDGFLSGVSYLEDRSGNKTVTEEIKLIRKGKSFFYVPDVAGDQGPVEFEITHFDKNSFIAENNAHDFPKKIVYKRISDQQLEATISGGNNSIRYTFRKI